MPGGTPHERAERGMERREAMRRVQRRQQQHATERQPTAIGAHDATAAYFQIGDVAYVLVTKADARGLDRSASRLAETLY